MHELSIAMSIIEGASQEATSQGGARIHAVHLKLGPLSGVAKDALAVFLWTCLRRNTSGRFPIGDEEVTVVVFCPNCDREKTLDSIQRFCCPSCGTLTPDVVSGRQLELVAIEITDREDVDLVPDVRFAEPAV